MAAEDWQLQAADWLDLRGAEFERVDWSPPPPEWVEVSRDSEGHRTGAQLRREPGPPGWGSGEHPAWDHDQCAICQRRLTSFDYDDGEPSAWRSGENWGDYTWICTSCFAAVAESSGWTVRT